MRTDTFYNDMTHPFECLSYVLLRNETEEFKINDSLIVGTSISGDKFILSLEVIDSIPEFIEWLSKKCISEIEVCYNNTVNNSLVFSLKAEFSSLNFQDAAICYVDFNIKELSIDTAEKIDNISYYEIFDVREL